MMAHLLEHALMMAWEVFWALVLGFLISAIIQAWIPRQRIENKLQGRRAVMRATALGAASSSCSYAAVAIAKTLFARGASAASALAFQFASTNLVWELGLVLWLLLGWQFALAEYLGGLLMIGLVAAGLRLLVSRRLEDQAREHSLGAEAGHAHHAAESVPQSFARHLRSGDSWSDVAHNFRGDWQMLYKEILIGFLLAGAASLLDPSVFDTLFLTNASPLLQAVWGVIIGPLIAILSFVCSVGNIPLAAVLYAHGLGFAGVIAFIFADLLVLPILAIYVKYYGRSYALRSSLLMATAMGLAALAVTAAFALVGLDPPAPPSAQDIFTMPQLDYRAWLNLLGLIIFISLFAITIRRGVRDPVCGMRVDRRQALSLNRDGRNYYFCSDHCRHRFTSAEDGNGFDTRPASGHRH